MEIEHIVAFATEPDQTGLEIRVNFGLFAGRDATAAEIDELGRLLLPEVGHISIVSEHRREIADGSEIALHQVRIEVGDDDLPRKKSERAELTEKLVTLAEVWARACIAERHADITEI